MIAYDPSNKAGEFDIELVAGAENLISLPLTPSEPYTSYSFLEYTRNDMEISRLDADTQEWETASRHGKKISGVDFPIVEGEGYLVQVSINTVYTFTGNVIATPITLTLKRGGNLVGIPYSTELYTSYTLITTITACIEVRRYNVEILSYEGTSFDKRRRVSGVDFDIKTGEGYYVYVMGETSWNPDSPAAPTIVPEETTLSQNYPNPLNPETWIPFQLAKASEVNIRICNATGQLIKTIQLGYKPACMYIEKSNAAYWDGRNDVGEKLASGLYFYELRTETLREIRKMILLK